MSRPYQENRRVDPIAALRALPTTLANQVVAAVIAYARWPFSVGVDAARRTAAESASMRHLGNCVEWFFLGWPCMQQVWVDTAGTTQARLNGRHYRFDTYFESGSCILTWDHRPSTSSNARLQSRAGGASFADDYAAHLDAIRDLRDRGELPLTVSRVSDATALGTHYYRFVSSGEALGVTLLGRTVAFLFFAITIARLFVRGRSCP